MKRSTQQIPRSFWIISSIALIWNIMGIVQYLAQAYMSQAVLEKLPEEQQQLYENIPAWVTAAFALAVFSGTLGAVLLLLKKRLAHPVFIFSFIAILVQMIYNLFFTQAVAIFGFQAYIFPVLIIIIGLYLVMYSKRAIINGWIS